MSDYSDKSFKELYSEVVEYVKTLTTKWDPSIADEADPGVAILKASCLLFDKVNYRNNYRNAQNSVREVTDAIEGEKLFYDLGYQVKKKKSATGSLTVRYLGLTEVDPSEDFVSIPLLTQFSDINESITFTSVRKESRIQAGKSSVIEVQEGIPVRYEYLGRKIFTDEDLSTNLRLPLVGYSELASNGIVICSAEESELKGGEELHPLVSNWLNVYDNVFTSVETSNLYSIGRDPDGYNYVQFYEDSLESLSRGIKIWVLSSYGSAGNIPSGRLSSVYSTEADLDQTKLVLSHSEFANGQDQESLTSAMENYYNTFGVNESLISQRDYSQVIESIVGPDLARIVSKALVSDVSAGHNMVQVLNELKPGNNTLLVRYATSALVSGILVNALKYTDDYYESFKLLDDERTIKFIRKALFKKNIVSNDFSLVDSKNTIYNKYLFDFAEIGGSIVIDSVDSEEVIRKQIISILSEAFNSRNLTAGTRITESQLASVVKNGLKGVRDCSFYYKKHKILKDVSNRNSSFSLDEEVDITARSILRGDLPLFSPSKITVPLDAGFKGDELDITGNYSQGKDGVINFQSDGSIKELSGKFTMGSGTKYTLKSNEFIQFYRVATVDSTTYGYGVKPQLLTPQWVVGSKKYSGSGDTNILLRRGSVIKSKSILVSVPGSSYDVDGKTYGGIHKDLIGKGNYFEDYVSDTVVGVECKKDYTVTDFMAMKESGTVLESGSIIIDGSYIGGKYHYQLDLQNGDSPILPEGTRLLLKTGESSKDYVEVGVGEIPKLFRLENFTTGLKSRGNTFSNDNWGDAFTSETLTTLAEDTTELKLDKSFKYGLVLNTKLEDLSKGEYYILGEGEHFIYSDRNLIDFVDFGSGTILQPGSSDSLKSLDNYISLESSLTEQMADLPFNLTLKNTEIYTFTPSGTENIILDGGSNNIPTLDNSWRVLSNKVEVTSGEVKQEFNNTYQARIGLILETGNDGVMELTSGQELSVVRQNSQGSTETTTLSVKNDPAENDPKTVYISTSQPLVINSATSQDLSEVNLGLSLYAVTPTGLREGVSGGCIHDSNKGFTYSFTLDDTIKAKRSFVIKFTEHSYLLKIKNLTTGSLRICGGYLDDKAVGQGVDSFVSNDEDSIEWTKGMSVLSEKVYGSENDNLILPGFLSEEPSGSYFYVPEYKGSKAIPALKFEITGGISGQVVEISSQQNLSGFNPGIFSSTGLLKESYENGVKILTRVTELAVGNSKDNPVIPFNYSYLSESPMKDILDPIKFYDTQHLLNKNILTVIDLDSLDKDEGDVKIIRRF